MIPAITDYGANPAAPALQNDGAIAEAIKDCAGGALYFPPGYFLIEGVGPAIFSMDSPTRIVGAGKGLTWLALTVSVPTTRDVFVCTGGGDGWAFEDFSIVTRDGSPRGRHCIVFDSGVDDEFRGPIVERCLFAYTPGIGIYAKGAPGCKNGGIVASSFEKNILMTRDGIRFEQAGDSPAVVRNVISGAGCGIYLWQIGGAGNAQIVGGNMTSADQIIIDRGTSPIIRDMQIEQSRTPLNSKKAMIFIRGAYAQVQGAQLMNNQMQALVPAVPIVLDNTQGTYWEGGRIGMPQASTILEIGEHSSNTKVGAAMSLVVGNDCLDPTAYVVDRGVGTRYVGADAKPLNSSWTPYAPVIGCASGAFGMLGPILGRWRLVGRTCHVRIRIPITDLGTAGTYVTATLPLPVSGASAIAGVFSGKDNSHSGKALNGYATAGTNYMAINNADGSFAGASGAVLTMAGTYEV